MVKKATTEFLSSGAWSTISAALRRSTGPCFVAVAYLGQNGAKLVPLPHGSWLVVDASKAAVSSGQTCPAELRKLVLNHGVRVFTRSNLHAKVYVTPHEAFIGSGNVSRHSAEALIEAFSVSRDRRIVGAATRFIRKLCKDADECGPEELAQLQKLYSPPKFQRGRFLSQAKRSAVGAVVKLAQLEAEEPPPESERVEQKAVKEARGRMSVPRRHELREFFWHGRAPFSKGDVIVEVFRVSSRKSLVSSAGKLVHTKTWSNGRRRITFCFVESPRVRRLDARIVATRIGRGGVKLLQRRGRVPMAFRERLLRALPRG